MKLTLEDTFWIIIFMIAFFGFGYMHEQVHVSIYKNYGIESEVGIDFPDLVTSVETSEYLEKCNDNCKLAHNINEAVSYPLMVVFAFLMIAFYVIKIELNIIQRLIEYEGIRN